MTQKALERRLKRLQHCSRAKLIWVAETAKIKLLCPEQSGQIDLAFQIANSGKPFKVPR